MSKKEQSGRPDEATADRADNLDAHWEKALAHRRRLRERQRQRRLNRLPGDRKPHGGREPAGI